MRLFDNKDGGFDNNNGGEVGDGACFEYLWGKMGGEVLAARARSAGVSTLEVVENLSIPEHSVPLVLE